ncbi:MAG: preprotein translocase subunit SecG [Candidatus Paceibacterota bacterium]|jgi:protein translocase SecG subunit
MIHKIISIVQIASSVVLIVLVMLQQKGGGLSGFLGGSSTNYMKKRGLEKSLHIFTIILMAIFIISSVMIFVVK